MSTVDLLGPGHTLLSMILHVSGGTQGFQALFTDLIIRYIRLGISCGYGNYNRAILLFIGAKFVLAVYALFYIWLTVLCANS